MTNAEIAQLFADIADMLEIQGEDRYRYLAYRRAADELGQYPGSVEALWREERLEEVPGVGKTIAAKIDELLSSGTLKFYERLRQEVPPSLIEVLRVPGVGPKRANLLWKTLGITDLATLEAAAKEGRLKGVKGLGAQTAQNILKGIEALHSLGDRMLLGTALPLAETLLEALRQAPGVVQAEMGGSLRRRKETVGDIDLLCAAEDTAPVVQSFTQLPQVREVQSAGENKATVMLHRDLLVDLIVLPPASWGSLLQHFTGSQAHNVELRSAAVAQGLHVSEWGITRGGVLTPYADEATHYRALGLDWIPPELREAEGELDAAREGRLPHLIDLGDVRGDLQMHTTWSDGTRSVEEMARAAQVLGYHWIAITDHSRGLGVTQGLDVARLREQRGEIDTVNERLAPFRVLRSVELEILADGTLDLPDDVLAELDVVVASVHTGQRADRPALMKRYLNAVHNPHVDIIAHPFGRLLNRRPPMDLDFEALVEACAATGTALEINGQADRMDLNGGQARYAMQRGVMISLASDAHHPDGLKVMSLAVSTARRAWLEPKHVLNAMTLDAFLAWLQR